MAEASIPRSSKFGSTMWSRGVFREPQQSNEPTMSEVTDSFSMVLPFGTAAACSTFSEVVRVLRFTDATRAPSEGRANTMPALTRDKAKIIGNRTLMVVADLKWREEKIIGKSQGL